MTQKSAFLFDCDGPLKDIVYTVRSFLVMWVFLDAHTTQFDM
jgi:hypothetical protein